MDEDIKNIIDNTPQCTDECKWTDEPCHTINLSYNNIQNRGSGKYILDPRYMFFKDTGVAQLVEHWSPKPGVGRSSRSSRANYL